MKELYLILVLFIVIYSNEKIGLKKIFYFINFNNLIKNIFFLLPIISIYLKQDSVLNSLTNYKLNTNKRNISQTIKKMVASNQKWHCTHCKNILDYTYEIDHIIPLYKGGSNEIYNLQALCRNCHGKKTIHDSIK
jgi:hypothetical protein